MRALAAWGLGFALAATPLLLLNAAQYGGPLRTGYSAGRLTGLAYPFPTGFYGLTLSSGKGFLWYSPPVLLALLGARTFARRHRAEALVCLGVVLTHLVFYARLSLWNGDWDWGPRYLLLMLPFALLPAAAFLAEARGRWTRRGAIVVAATLGVGVQLLGVLVNPFWDRGRVYAEPQTNAERAARIAARYFAPPASPLVIHARLLTRNLAEWGGRVMPPPDTAVLDSGFAAPEADPGGATFPRWTTGAGVIALHPGAREPVTVKLTFFDHRPPALRRGEPDILVNGAPLPPGAVERRDFSGDGTGWIYQVTVPAGAFHTRGATVTIASPTWNPRAVGAGDRDEALGVYIHGIEAWRAGMIWRVRDRPTLLTTGAIGAVPPAPVDLYTWYNDDRAFATPGDADPVHHLADHWAWYGAVAGLDRRTTLVWLAAYGGIAAAPLLVGGALCARTLPRRAARIWWHPHRVRREGHGRAPRPGAAAEDRITSRARQRGTRRR